MRRPKALRDDFALVDAVGCELEWDTKVDAVGVRISANDGAVMLSGHVPSQSQKRAAVRAAERVSGVRVVADDIDVRLPQTTVREDRKLAEAIAHERAWSTRIPDSIRIQVNKGHVTMRGKVQRSYQREDVESAIRHLSGVRGVTNRISVREEGSDEADRF